MLFQNSPVNINNDPDGYKTKEIFEWPKLCRDNSNSFGMIQPHLNTSSRLKMKTIQSWQIMFAEDGRGCWQASGSGWECGRALGGAWVMGGRSLSVVRVLGELRAGGLARYSAWWRKGWEKRKKNRHTLSFNENTPQPLKKKRKKKKIIIIIK